jgi:multicomponent Na+:H+ antiporter subunit G
VIRTSVAALLLTLGVAFIAVAALGVARLPDVFQRMHAATKAGGIGVTLVMLGVLLAGGVARPTTGVLTIVFMLLTLSVASQLLARAAYMSGATARGLHGEDPLAGVLPRHDAPLEERIDESNGPALAAHPATTPAGEREPRADAVPGVRRGALHHGTRDPETT